MTDCYISFRHRDFIEIDDGYRIVIKTDIPSHLFMRWSTNPPQYHTVPSYRRGLAMHGDRYICFTVFKENEQEEAGDTLIHTFIKTGWRMCETRYFYFWGSVASQFCRSTSPVFKLHRPVISPVSTIATFHNRFMYSRHGTWSTARDGFNPQKLGDYQRPNSTLLIATSLIAQYTIYRSYLSFNTTIYPEHRHIVSARIGLYVTAKSTVDFDFIVCPGLWREPVVDTDWLPATNDTTLLGSINTGAMLLNQYNWIDLNPIGLGWINHSRAEHTQHESYDWQKTQFWPIYSSRWASQSFAPQTTHALTRVKLRIKKVGNPPGIYCSIYLAGVNGCPSGTPIDTVYLDPGSIPGGLWGDWVEFIFPTSIRVTAGNTYCIVLHHVGGDATNCTHWVGAGGTAYQNGHGCYSVDGGGVWTPYPTQALYFIEYRELLEGQTNFVLKTASDNSNSPPGAGITYSCNFHSSQKGTDYYPILEITFK